MRIFKVTIPKMSLNVDLYSVGTNNTSVIKKSQSPQKIKAATNMQSESPKKGKGKGKKRRDSDKDQHVDTGNHHHRCTDTHTTLPQSVYLQGQHAASSSGAGPSSLGGRRQDDDEDDKRIVALRAKQGRLDEDIRYLEKEIASIEEENLKRALAEAMEQEIELKKEHKKT